MPWLKFHWPWRTRGRGSHTLTMVEQETKTWLPDAQEPHTSSELPTSGHFLCAREIHVYPVEATGILRVSILYIGS